VQRAYSAPAKCPYGIHRLALAAVLYEVTLMTRFGLLAAVLTLGLAGCSLGTNSTDQKMVCYDTGSGVKCVQQSLLPAGAQAVCEDNDGDTNNVSSESSDDGPSADDDDVSASSDAADGDESDSTGDADDGEDECDALGDSDSEDSDEVDGTSESSDTDGDGVGDADDCDCTTQPPPDGGGDGGTPIPRLLRLQRPAMSTLSR